MKRMFSGDAGHPVCIRLPKELHADLSRVAAAECVELSSLIRRVLARERARLLREMPVKDEGGGE